MIFLFVVVQAADLLTALLMPRTNELNDLAHALLERPELTVTIKIALIVLVLAYVKIAEQDHRRLATGVLAFGTFTGIVGAVSNMAVLAVLMGAYA